jgi:hypothetical protein
VANDPAIIRQERYFVGVSSDISLFIHDSLMSQNTVVCGFLSAEPHACGALHLASSARSTYCFIQKSFVLRVIFFFHQSSDFISVSGYIWFLSARRSLSLFIHDCNCGFLANRIASALHRRESEVPPDVSEMKSIQCYTVLPYFIHRVARWERHPLNTSIVRTKSANIISSSDFASIFMANPFF